MEMGYLDIIRRWMRTKGMLQGSLSGYEEMVENRSGREGVQKITHLRERNVKGNENYGLMKKIGVALVNGEKVPDHSCVLVGAVSSYSARIRHGYKPPG